MKQRSLWVLVALMIGGLPARGLAQPERYELGRRLGFFERAWDKQPDDDGRKKAVPFIEQVPLLAILGNLGDAGQAFDRARWALVDDKGYTPEVQWAESLGINIGRLFTLTFALGSGMAALGGGLGAGFSWQSMSQIDGLGFSGVFDEFERWFWC